MLSDFTKRLGQRTGGQDIFSRDGLRFFAKSVSLDLAEIVGQLNEVYLKLIDNLAEFTDNDPRELGLSGNTLWSDVEADSNSGNLFWDSIQSRKLTIKESLQYLNSNVWQDAALAVLSHSVFTDLGWVDSGHTGDNNSVAGFDGSGDSVCLEPGVDIPKYHSLSVVTSGPVTLSTTQDAVALGATALTVNLPALSTWTPGRTLIIKDLGFATGTPHTVDPNGTDSIESNGAGNSVSISTNWNSLVLFPDIANTRWLII